MRRFPLHERVKVPVVKNIVFALKLVWQTDKKLFIGYLINMTVDGIFKMFVQNILFLKILLGIIDRQGSFEEYFRNLLMFLGVSVFLKAVNWSTNYMRQAATKNVLKGLNNLVFRKAISLDVSCYEDPSFYDKYQRATNVLAWSYFDAICSSVFVLIGFCYIIRICFKNVSLFLNFFVKMYGRICVRTIFLCYLLVCADISFLFHKVVAICVVVFPISPFNFYGDTTIFVFIDFAVEIVVFKVFSYIHILDI